MSASPILIVLRGNSGSGKSAAAQAIRQQYGYGLAWVEQDHLRRILLREKDIAGGKNIELIALNVRYCLAAGYHVVLEGILNAERYGEMLEGLRRDYGGYWYYFDLPFEETLRRHATKPLAAHIDAATLHTWYRERDLLPFVPERQITAESTLAVTVAQILAETNLLAAPAIPAP